MSVRLCFLLPESSLATVLVSDSRLLAPRAAYSHLFLDIPGTETQRIGVCRPFLFLFILYLPAPPTLFSPALY